MSTFILRRTAFLLPAVAGAIAFWFLAPIPQPEAYHHFADGRTILGIANFWNVVSNLPFAFVGLLGLARSRDAGSRTLFAGIFLVALGSSYYHLAPSTARLAWDRTPMTVAFMAVLALLVEQCWGVDAGRKALLPLLAIGLFSIVWWRATGDLRLYVLVQFVPILTIAAVLFVFKPLGSGFLWLAFILYAAAKLCEYFDPQIYETLRISGHTIKHLLAAYSTYWIYRWRLKGIADAQRVVVEGAPTVA